MNSQACLEGTAGGWTQTRSAKIWEAIWLTASKPGIWFVQTPMLRRVGQRARGWLHAFVANEVAIVAGPSLSFFQFSLQLLDIAGDAFDVSGEFLPVVILAQGHVVDRFAPRECGQRLAHPVEGTGKAIAEANAVKEDQRQKERRAHQRREGQRV